MCEMSCFFLFFLMCEMFLDFFFANIFFLLILLLCQSLFHSQSTWHNCRFLLMWLCTTGWEWNPFSAVMSRLSPFNQVSIILVTFEGGYRFSLVHLNISFPVLSAWICLSVLFHFALVIIMITVNVFLMRWIPLIIHAWGSKHYLTWNIARMHTT